MEQAAVQKKVRVLEPAPKKRKKVAIVIFALVLAATLLAGFYFLRPKDSIPKDIREAVNFPVYYPEKLPDGYKLDKNSIKTENGIVFFILKNGSNQNITVSEQNTPQNKPDLKNTPGFGEIPSTAGEAGAGTVNGVPVVIILGDKTMINISGSKDVQQDILNKITQSMNPLPN